jgi:tetratricopeptide (TPR) repeat protein
MDFLVRSSDAAPVPSRPNFDPQPPPRKKLALVAILVLLLVPGAHPCEAASAPKERDLYNEALLALKAGDTRTALEFFSRALNTEPGNYRYYNDRGVAYKRSGDLDKAIADYSKALEIKPDYTNALNNRGVAYTQQGKYELAIQDFTEALKLGEMKGKLHMNLGAVFAKSGDHSKAIREFDAAASYQPLDRNALVLFGDCLDRAGNHERALKTYQLALGIVADATMVRTLEKKISDLERKTGASRTSPLTLGSVNGPASSIGAGAVEPTQIREILPSPPKKDPARIHVSGYQTPAKPQQPAVAAPSVAGNETPKGLDERCRARALEKFTPASVEIYNQGVQFLEQSYPRKALVRFEDTLQLEKRNKNAHGVGWSLLEIGRVHAKAGDNVRALVSLDEALKVFSRMKAGEETILVLLEIASNSKRLSQMDKAKAAYAKAVDEANSKGLSDLAKLIGDVAAGKTLAEPTKTAAPEKKTADARQPSENLARADREKISQTQAQPKHGPEKKATQVSEPTVQIRLTQSAPQAVETTPEKEQKADRGPQKSTPQKPDPVLSSPNSQRLADIGKGPAVWGASGKDLKLFESRTQIQEKKPDVSSGSPEKIARPSVSPTGQANAPRPLEQAGGPPAVHRAPLSSTDVNADLAELRKRRDANDELNMMAVLDRLADKYSRRQEYPKALHAITASLAFRDKLGISKGMESALERSGFIKEQLGDEAGALEDLSRAIFMERSTRGSTASPSDYERRARRLASQLGVDYVAVFNAFQLLWKARATGGQQEETEALHLVGRLYDKADKPAQALNYYERSSASMLADKARIYEKMGKEDLAEQSYTQALEAFKKFDYSRYLELKKKRKDFPAISSQ